jgi:hypothetical protein
MHKKYAKDGLVALPVSIDSLKVDEEDKLTPTQKMDDVLQKVSKVTRERSVSFPIVILDDRGEAEDFPFKKLRFSEPPCVYIFSRDGKWTQIVGADEKDLASIDKLVEELLKKK